MTEPPRDPIDLLNSTLTLDRGGKARVLENRPGPPKRIDGLTIGAPLMTGPDPHDGEMHPDGDELLFLVSGKVTVVVEDQTPPRRVELAPGQAIVVPRGVWHKVLIDEPSQIVHVTPGPGGEHRPL
jgi:mannose-6-phosphate isomerase-like protein (cupin superfamily)